MANMQHRSWMIQEKWRENDLGQSSMYLLLLTKQINWYIFFIRVFLQF